MILNIQTRYSICIKNKNIIIILKINKINIENQRDFLIIVCDWFWFIYTVVHNNNK